MKAILFLLLLIIVISCSDDPASINTLSANDDSGLMPLNVGNNWIYGLGFKETGAGSVKYDSDTLRVVSETDSGYYLESRTQIVMPNGFYKNKEDGLYLGDRLQFKYPLNIGEECGEMFLMNEKDTDGKPPVGYLSKNDYKYSLSNPSQSIDTLDNCYYYFLQTFYQSDSVHVNGITIFKPGIGLVFMDWVDITVTNERRLYNYAASLQEYKIN